MPRKQLVIDQNFFRSSDLRQIVESDSDSRFIITDEAFMEMCKSPEWGSTLHNSLSILSTSPSRVKVATSVGDALRWEISHKNSIAGRLVDKVATGFIREVLESVANGTNSNNLQRMRSRIVQIQEELHSNRLNHSANKEHFIRLVNVTGSFVKDHFAKSLRNNSVSREEKLLSIREQSTILLEQFFNEAGFSKEKARFFIKKKPLLLRSTHLRLWRCLDWIEKGGLENISDKKLTNEELDDDYVLIASFFGGILSKEAKVRQAYEDLMWMISN